MTLAWLALALGTAGASAFIAYWTAVGLTERHYKDDLDLSLRLYADAMKKYREVLADNERMIAAAGLMAPSERAIFDRIAARYTREAA